MKPQLMIQKKKKVNLNDNCTCCTHPVNYIHPFMGTKAIVIKKKEKEDRREIVLVKYKMLVTIKC